MSSCLAFAVFLPFTARIILFKSIILLICNFYILSYLFSLVFVCVTYVCRLILLKGGVHNPVFLDSFQTLWEYGLLETAK